MIDLAAAIAVNLDAGSRRHLEHPQAVILDTTHERAPAFLLLYDGGRKSGKVVVRINYRLKKTGERNIVETGKWVDPSGIRAQIGQGYELVEGNL